MHTILDGAAKYRLLLQALDIDATIDSGIRSTNVIQTLASDLARTAHHPTRCIE